MSDKTEENKKSESLFKKIYRGAEELIKEAKLPNVERATKRRFESAYDDADDKIYQLENKLDDLRKNIKDIDVNAICEARVQIETLESLKAAIKEEYKILFDEDYPVKL